MSSWHLRILCTDSSGDLLGESPGAIWALILEPLWKARKLERRKLKELLIRRKLGDDHRNRLEALVHLGERDEEAYNVEFHDNLTLVATRDITAGDELFVNYNFNGEAYITT